MAQKARMTILLINIMKNEVEINSSMSELKNASSHIIADLDEKNAFTVQAILEIDPRLDRKNRNFPI